MDPKDGLRMSMKLIQDLLCKKKVNPILYFYEGSHRKRSLTYSELKVASENLAQALIEQGLTREPVLISLPNSVEFAVSYFAVLLAGGIPVPIATSDFLSTDGFSNLLSHISKITEARFCLSFQSYSTTPSILCWDPNTLKARGSFQGIYENTMALGSEDLALIQFSSGSTLEPKGVMLSHRNIFTNLEQIRLGMEVSSQDILSSWLPFNHDMGLIGGLLSCLYNEVEGHFSTAIDFIASPKSWLQRVCETKTSVIMGPNFLYRNLLKRIHLEDRKEYNMSSLRLALCGAEPVSSTDCQNFNDAYQAQKLRQNVMFPVYGMAENTLAVTFPKVGESMTVLRACRKSLALGKYRPGGIGDPEFVSCGKPLREVKLRISNDLGNSVDQGNVGEIQYQSPSMTLGYWRAPELTKELFSEDGWLKTGDLGFLFQGQLFVTGRSKDVLILNGRKYFSQDIENTVAQISNSEDKFNVGRVAAFLLPRDLENEYGIAVETNEWIPWRRKALRKEISHRCYVLARIQPNSIYLLAPCALPRTSSGKLKRFVLKEWLANGILARRERWHLFDQILRKVRMIGAVFNYLGKNLFRLKKDRVLDPSSALLDYLAQIFSEVIQVPVKKIEPEKSFLDYQLDSVQVIQLNTILKKDSIEIPLNEFIGIENLLQLRDYLLENHRTDVRNLPMAGR